MSDRSTILATVHGPDRPGISAGLMDVLSATGAEVYDVEQIVVRGRLTLNVLIGVDGEKATIRDLLLFGWEQRLHVEFEVVDPIPTPIKAMTVVTLLGERIGRSWILLFGLVPFDYDDLTLVRLEPGRGFLERSTMLSQRLWEHERTIAPDGRGGCRIADRVCWQPRLGFPARPLRPAIAWFFRHRHKRLRRRFGGVQTLR